MGLGRDLISELGFCPVSAGGAAEGINKGSRGTQENQEGRILVRTPTVVPVANVTSGAHLPGLG